MSGFFALLFFIMLIPVLYYGCRALINYGDQRKNGWQGFSNKYVKRMFASIGLAILCIVLFEVSLTPEERAERDANLVAKEQAKIDDDKAKKEAERQEKAKEEEEQRKEEQRKQQEQKKQEEQKQVAQSKPVENKQAPNYKYIFKQDLPRITGAECIINMNTLDMNWIGKDFVIFHCTALLNGTPTQIEALYYASDGKLIQMKTNNEVIFHDTSR